MADTTAMAPDTTAAMATKLKDEGNAKFGAGDYAGAIDAYSQAIDIDPTHHVCFSNRSAAYLKQGNAAEKALHDAQRCVELAPSFAKGYSRQAAGLQDLKRWDEAIAICEEGFKVTSDDSLQRMRVEVQSRQTREKMRGTWHGTVSQALGGYDQEMEFVNDSEVRIEVLGRSIVGRYWMDCSVEPFHLNIQVPMQDMPPGMPPPPPVPYIVKADDTGLHICCPVMAMDRPADFTGDGYCLMKKGSLTALAQDREVSKLTRDEKLLRCARELIDALPTNKLEQLSPQDSEEVAREKVMAQVRFESSMYLVQNKFGGDTVKEVLTATRTPTEVPKALQGTKELRDLEEKLKTCGVLDDEAAQAMEGGDPTSAPLPLKPTKPPAGMDSSEPEQTDTASGSQSTCIIAAGAAAVVAVAAVLVLRQKK